MSCIVRIESDDPARQAEARAFAARTALPLIDGRGDALDSAALTLAMRDSGWELRDAVTRPDRGLRIDLTHLARRGRRAVNLSRKQPLARAIGRASRSVIDATAGLGQDAALLAAMGLEVLAIERDAVLAAMLAQAAQFAAADPAAAALFGGRLRVVQGDARLWLAEDRPRADCVYLDPMFPPKRKASALARKEIRLVRALVGDDPDANELLTAARAAAPRVVVKRPTHAAPLAEGVSAIVSGTLVRYDVYIAANRSAPKQ